MKWDKLLNAKRIKYLSNPKDADIEKVKTEGDRRSEFERDYDRCLFSTPVRRLQDKAQVFPLEPHDSVRTRLTHSLEVSNIAKGIAGRVAEWLVTKGFIRSEEKESVIL